MKVPVGRSSIGIAWASAALVALGLSACASGPRLTATSGLIGCPPDEIQYTEGEMFTGTWTATCRGHLFHCASYDPSGTGKSQYACKEDLQPAPCKAVPCAPCGAEGAAAAPEPAPSPSASPTPRAWW